MVSVIEESRMHNSELDAKLNRSVELLTEHRQALITAAVTGGLEVAGA